ncbi:hypothetical protein GSY74_03675 [Sulfurovum sp. bin170]|uniref:hypothetical protein n=1 Tax=Sulfurovum sp. bin170 TaxID=2695268 RepID=UPI0013E06F56|nr:hypothetical protein [Sulfurovum sp. bin170]NEW60371.1 hypothetical protein [Sulfurovum sp. bin170]
MMKFIFLIGIVLFSGCNTPAKMQSIDPKENQLTTIRWGESDLQEMANRVATHILSSSTIDFSKSYSFGKIKNRSHDHIDTKHLADKISMALVQSGKVKIVEKEKGKSSGIFFGKISSIFKKNDRTKDMFFNFNLTLTERETSRVVWSHDVEIRKVYNKAMFGW